VGVKKRLMELHENNIKAYFVLFSVAVCSGLGYLLLIHGRVKHLGGL